MADAISDQYGWECPIKGNITKDITLKPNIMFLVDECE